MHADPHRGSQRKVWRRGSNRPSWPSRPAGGTRPLLVGSAGAAGPRHASNEPRPPQFVQAVNPASVAAAGAAAGRRRGGGHGSRRGCRRSLRRPRWSTHLDRRPLGWFARDESRLQARSTCGRALQQPTWQQLLGFRLARPERARHPGPAGWPGPRPWSSRSEVAPCQCSLQSLAACTMHLDPGPERAHVATLARRSTSD